MLSVNIRNRPVRMLGIKWHNVALRWEKTCRSSVPKGTGYRERSEISWRGWRIWKQSREPRAIGWTGSMRKWRAWRSRGQKATLRSTSAQWRWSRLKYTFEPTWIHQHKCRWIIFYWNQSCPVKKLDQDQIWLYQWKWNSSYLCCVVGYHGQTGQKARQSDLWGFSTRQTDQQTSAAHWTTGETGTLDTLDTHYHFRSQRAVDIMTSNQSYKWSDDIVNVIAENLLIEY